MLAVHCPRCGRPVAVSLARPDVVTCSACGHAGPPPAHAAEALRAAAQTLFQSDVHGRQFSAALRDKLRSAERHARRYQLVLILTATPITLLCLFMALGMAVSEDTEGNIAMGLLFAFAWSSSVGAGLVGLALLRGRQRRLEAACSAVPPRTPGEPAACHVCGAPLAGGVEGVARCGFCGADNLVDPRVLARLRHKQALSLGSYEQAVQAELRAFADATTRSSVALVPLAVLIPFGSFILFIIVFVIIDLMRLPVDASVRYAAVETPQGRCIGKVVTKPDGSEVVRFGAWRAEGLPEAQPLAPGEAEIFTASALVGRTVRRKDGMTGKVEEVFASSMEGNAAAMRAPEGIAVDSSIAGLCFAEDAAQPASSAAAPPSSASAAPPPATSAAP